jgi:16S rRNA (adenine1518-N6/adenine1519-N6)-dimethyltransferase
VQSQCDAQIVRMLAPSVFWPRPQVHSAIVHIDVDQQRRAQIADLAFFHDFVRALFSHRRKFLRSVLAAAFNGALDKSAVERILSQQGVSHQARGEQLDLAAILRLAEAVRRALASRRGE